MKQAPFAAPAISRSISGGNHEAIVAELTTELVAALERAAGDEKEVLDTIFLFVHRAHARRIGTGVLPEIFGVSVARSSLSPGEREMVFRMFPRCAKLVASAGERQRPRGGWWKWRRPRTKLTLDLGQHCV